MYSVNDKCPCGSGKKFKKCCLLNENKEKDIRDMISLMHKKYKKSVCYHPNPLECNGKIKDCHTIQNNKILNKLSVNGKVYMFSYNITLENIHKLFSNFNVIEKDIENIVVFDQMLVEVGRNSATTFKGFCDYHDSVLFKDIETRDFNYEEKQYFEYAYRALIHRIYAEDSTFHLMRDTVKNISGEELKNENNKLGFLGKLKSKELGYNDLLNEKKEFDNALLTDNFDILSNYYMELPFEIKFAFTDRIVVDFDLIGKRLNDSFSLKIDDYPKSFYLTVIPENGKTLILFSTLKKYLNYFKPSINEFIKCSIDVKYNILINLMFRYCDVIVISPKLLNILTGEEENKIVETFYNFLPYSPIPKEMFKDLKGAYLPNLFSK